MVHCNITMLVVFLVNVFLQDCAYKSCEVHFYDCRTLCNALGCVVSGCQLWVLSGAPMYDLNVL